MASDVGSNWYQLNVTYWMEAFINGTYNDYGFCIRDSNESDIDVWTTWRSSDYSGTSYDPILTINYGTPNPYNSVSVRLSAETLFRNQNPTNYGALMNTYLDEAADAFYNTYEVNLYAATNYDLSNLLGSSCPNTSYNQTCNSTCGALSNCRNVHHKNMDRNCNQLIGLNLDEDIRVCFIGFDPCFYNTSHHGTYGCAKTDNAMVRTYDDQYTVIRTVQHEVSHLFGCHDEGTQYGYCTGPCIMSSGFNGLNEVKKDCIWCSHCQQYFDSSLQ